MSSIYNSYDASAPGPYGGGRNGETGCGPMSEVHEDLLFSTEKGDICLRLIECWPQMLSDTAILGSVLILSRTEQVVLASRVNRTDFWPVPGMPRRKGADPVKTGSSVTSTHEIDSSVLAELGSGFAVDLNDLHFAVAADERLESERMLALQFFDKHGAGMFKVIMTDETEYEWYTRFIQHYARGGSPPRISAETRPPLPAPGALAADPAGLDWLRRIWPHLDPSVPGDFIHGWEDITRLEALELVGSPFAALAGYEQLVQALLFASQAQIPLSFTLFNLGLHHQVTMVPRRMERCGDSIHLMDRDSEAHILRAPGLSIWRTTHRPENGAMLEIYSSDRRRCCHIQCVGEPMEIRRWSRQLEVVVVGLAKDEERDRSEAV